MTRSFHVAGPAGLVKPVYYDMPRSLSRTVRQAARQASYGPERPDLFCWLWGRLMRQRRSVGRQADRAGIEQRTTPDSTPPDSVDLPDVWHRGLRGRMESALAIGAADDGTWISAIAQRSFAARAGTEDRC